MGFILQSNIQILNSRRQKISKDYEMMSNMLREALGLNRQQQVVNQQAGQGYQKVDPGARQSPVGGVQGMRGPPVGGRQPADNMAAGSSPSNMSGAVPHTSPAFRSGVVGQVISPPPVPTRNIPPQRHVPNLPSPGADAARNPTRRPVRSSSGFFGQHPAKQTSAPPPQQPMTHQPHMHTPQMHMQQVSPNMGGVPPRTQPAQHKVPARRPLRAQARPRGY